jgi:hypothetical protein
MEWTKRTSAVEVGETVAYSKRFLQSTGQLTGDAPFARGQVTALTTLGSIVLAEITWADDAQLPARVNVKNLVRRLRNLRTDEIGLKRRLQCH